MVQSSADLIGLTSDAEVAWYGDARIVFVGQRVFVFSCNLVKEAVYQNATISVVRQLDLALGGIDTIGP